VGDVTVSEWKPFAGASAVASGVYGILEFGLVNVDSILSVLVPLAYRIAPRVQWLPENALEKAVFGLSVVFVLYAGARLAGKAIERFT
jgi:hypothetical protein